jgi:putative DNA primase/helicase
MNMRRMKPSQTEKRPSCRGLGQISNPLPLEGGCNVSIAQEEARRNAGVRIPVEAEGIHEELKSFDHWVVWKAIPKDGSKIDKWPYNARSGELASTRDSRTWSTFEEALSTYVRDGWDGIGFVFSSGDPFTGIDFDEVRKLETGAVDGWVREWLDTFDGYAEVSPSGKGIHVLIKGKATSRKGTTIEVYSLERFFTITGVRP